MKLSPEPTVDNVQNKLKKKNQLRLKRCLSDQEHINLFYREPEFSSQY